MQRRREALGQRRRGCGRRGWRGGWRWHSRRGATDAARRGWTEQLGTDKEGHDHGGGAEADGHELVHPGQPPRDAQVPVPGVSSRWLAARTGPCGQEPGSHRAPATPGPCARRTARRSCQAALLDDGLRVRLDGGAQRPCGVVQSEFGRSRPGCRASRRTPDQGQPDVMVVDQDHPLVEREPAEGSLQLVAVGDGEMRVGCGQPVDRQDPARSSSSAGCAWPRRSRHGRGCGGPRLRSDRPPAGAAARARP